MGIDIFNIYFQVIQILDKIIMCMFLKKSELYFKFYSQTLLAVSILVHMSLHSQDHFLMKIVLIRSCIT